MRNDAQSFIFNALRNALYHTAQRRTNEARARWLNFAVIVLGAATVADFLEPWGIKVIHLGGLTTVIGALQLTFDFGGRARTHQILQHDYYKALADFQAIAEPTERNVAEANSRLTTIMADEPPILRAVDAKAHNDALDATDFFASDQRLQVPFLHRRLKNLYAFEGSKYRTLADIKSENERNIPNAQG
ncbi:hypothetical protein [Leisingera aquaemixtae]|uniref:hypothetical protein n=1 Tax=Leisingera aquaemixtae TaxID=1396826 RepID=UPI0021A4439A|nr:hypothetical protein [Leisingera aquaemixtae]UWQ47288.1 hypothetical protein K3719_07965 [Leisingera aquaemixtae]